MITRRTMPPKNPRNEALRQKVFEQEESTRNDLEKCLPDLKMKTKQVHIGWLFSTKGLPALKDLCLMMHSTSNSIPRSGWRDLAFQLQLDSPTIACIDNERFQGETETYNTLLTAAQNSERTIEDVIDALTKIGRFDVLFQSWDSIEGLVTEILENERISSNTQASDDIIKPLLIPKPPSIVLQSDESLSRAQDYLLAQKLFQEGDYSTARISQKIEYRVPVKRDHEFAVCATPAPAQSPEIKRNVKRNHYDCTIMLTFASDGEKVVEDIRDKLRQKREDGRCIGVLILQEHSHKVELNPQQFIFSVFQQVNYVMPVITNGYLEAIASISSNSRLADHDYIDSEWTRYIYTLMNNDYINRGCLNTKVRCLVPDDMIHLTQRHRRMREPIFETWYKVNEIEKLCNRLVNYKKIY